MPVVIDGLSLLCGHATLLVLPSLLPPCPPAPSPTSGRMPAQMPARARPPARVPAPIGAASSIVLFSYKSLSLLYRHRMMKKRGHGATQSIGNSTLRF